RYNVEASLKIVVQMRIISGLKDILPRTPSIQQLHTDAAILSALLNRVNWQILWYGILVFLASNRNLHLREEPLYKHRWGIQMALLQRRNRYSPGQCTAH